MSLQLGAKPYPAAMLNQRQFGSEYEYAEVAEDATIQAVHEHDYKHPDPSKPHSDTCLVNCTGVVYDVAEQYDEIATAVGGNIPTPKGERFHAWNRVASGDIIDATYGQFTGEPPSPASTRVIPHWDARQQFEYTGSDPDPRHKPWGPGNPDFEQIAPHH